MEDTDDLNPFLGGSLAGELDPAAVMSALGEIRESYISRELKAREDSYCSFETLNVGICTWNVNSSMPTQPLDELFLGILEQPVDLFAFGFQELNVSADAYLYTDTIRETAWCDAIELQLEKTNARFTKVASKQLSSLLIVLYASANVSPHITDVSTSSVGTGMLGLGNKGGVSIRARVKDSYYVFVNSHLAADSSQVERRNQDFVEIVKRTRFSTKERDYKEWTLQNPFVTTWRESLGELNNTSPVGKVLYSALHSASRVGRTANSSVAFATLFDCDHLFWAGDLNYRVSFPDGFVREKIAAKEFELLLMKDQLTEQQASGLVFPQFVEAPISFPPTYKFDAGTSLYDTSEKKRVPSWCDRILYFYSPLRSPVTASEPNQGSHVKNSCLKPSLVLSPLSLNDRDVAASEKKPVSNSTGGDQVPVKPWAHILRYSSAHTVLLSDHKPVFAIAETQLRKVEKGAVEQASASIARELDKYENESLPNLEIFGQTVQVTSPEYLVPQTYTVELSNKGKVPARWWFVPKPGERSICKSIYSVEPTRGMLRPNETAKVNVSLNLDGVSVNHLNIGQETLEDILVLHIDNGRDHFLLLQGEMRPTCFGLELWLLLLIENCDRPKPISQYSSTELGAILSSPPPKRFANQSPQIFAKVVEALRVLQEFDPIVLDTIFFVNGSAPHLHYIGQCLDNLIPFDLNWFAVKNSTAAQSGTGSESATLPFFEEVSEASAREIQEREFGIEKPPKTANGLHSFTHSLAETLLKLIQALPQPLIPPQVLSSVLAVDWGKLRDPARAGDARIFLEKELEQFHGHYALWTLIMDYLKSVSDSLSATKRSAVEPYERICRVFSPILLPLYPTETGMQQGADGAAFDKVTLSSEESTRLHFISLFLC